MSEWFPLGLIILAAWRLTSLVVDEEGPFRIFYWWRVLLGIRHHDDGNVAEVPGNILGRLFGCFWCFSLWSAGIMYVVWRYEPTVVYIGAVSAGAILVDRLISIRRP